MSIIRGKTSRGLVRSLFELANTPFTADAYRGACVQIGKYNSRSSDRDLWYFMIGRMALMIVVVEAERVSFAVLSTCWWNTPYPDQHRNEKIWRAERTKFDLIYDSELKRATAAIGLPILSGQDQDEDAHRWGIWRGKTGLLVLQQSSYDPQFGLDVNYWLLPWKGRDPRPTSPFVSWLFRQDAKLSKP